MALAKSWPAAVKTSAEVYWLAIKKREEWDQIPVAAGSRNARDVSIPEGKMLQKHVWPCPCWSCTSDVVELKHQK